MGKLSLRASATSSLPYIRRRPELRSTIPSTPGTRRAHSSFLCVCDSAECAGVRCDEVAQTRSGSINKRDASGRERHSRGQTLCAQCAGKTDATRASQLAWNRAGLCILGMTSAVCMTYSSAVPRCVSTKPVAEEQGVQLESRSGSTTRKQRNVPVRSSRNIIWVSTAQMPIGQPGTPDSGIPSKRRGARPIAPLTTGADPTGGSISIDNDQSFCAAACTHVGLVPVLDDCRQSCLLPFDFFCLPPLEPVPARVSA